MSEKIEPGLSAEFWTLARHLKDRGERQDGAPWMVATEDLSDVEMIALSNFMLPNSDRGKITRTWVNWLREEAGILKRGGAGAGALMAAEIADGLERYLPP